MLGQNPVLPIELVVPTWQSLPWGEVRSHADLIAVRATQLQLRRDNVDVMVLVWDAIKSIDKSLGYTGPSKVGPRRRDREPPGILA